MILSCPSCKSRFLVDPAAVGTGRQVRCGRCKHEWFATPPEEPASALELEPPVEPSPIRPRPIPPGSNLPALPKQKKRRTGMIIGWLVFVLVAGGIGAAIWKRDMVMARVPATTKVFEVLGLAAEPQAVLLRVEDIKLARTTQDGVPVLQIEGRIVNTGTVARTVPTLRGILQDAAEREIQSWTFSVPAERLDGGQSVAFKTEVRQPAAAAQRVSIVFTEPR
jgi:predicted Zn finger-like uncharacterized protein